MKKVLILAYYFPPLGMGGTQRTSKFAKYLFDFGWEPIVVTVKDIAYFARDESLLAELDKTEIHRTNSLDLQRLFYLLYSPLHHKTPNLSINRNKHFIWQILSFFFMPDAKILWLPFALYRSLKLLKRKEIDCVLTTSPPHSIHLAGLFLKWVSGIKWVVDFRDGWAGGNFQVEPTRFHVWLNRRLQKWVIRAADRVVVVSAGLKNQLVHQTQATAEKFTVITNGFDADDFKKIEPVANSKQFEIVYCGALTNISPVDSFLLALANLVHKYPAIKTQFQVRFVGINLQANLPAMISELDLGECINFTGYLPHLSALEKLMSADLLIYPIAHDASTDFIPGKTFEYLASGKPILAIGPNVEGMRILKQFGSPLILAHKDLSAIETAIRDCLRNRKSGFSHKYNSNHLSKFERKQLTKQLAQIFDSLD